MSRNNEKKLIEYQNTSEKRKKELEKELILDNAAFVRKYALQFKNIFDFDFDDRISVGNIALLKAIRGFDPSRGWKFSTYAGNCIFRDLNRAYRKNRVGGGVNCPTDLNTETFATKTRVTSRVVAQSELDLDDEVWDLCFLTEDDYSSFVVDSTMHDYEDREKIIVRMLAQGYNMAECGEMLGVSRERIRIIVKESISENKTLREVVSS